MRAPVLMVFLAWLAGCTDVSTVPPSPDASAPPPAIAQLVIQPTKADFGTIAVFRSSPPVQFTVKNMGAATSGTLAIRSSSDFRQGSTCGALNPGGTCTISVVFIPGQPGAKENILSVQAVPGGIAYAALSGVGVATGLTIMPATHDFGGAVVGTSTDLFSFTVTNPGSILLAALSVNLAGTGFELENSGCRKTAILAPGASCTVGVRFAPSSRGVRSGVLLVSAGGLNAMADLSGTASTAPMLAMVPSSAQLTGKVGVDSAPIKFTAANVGDLPSGVPTVAITDDAQEEFKLVENDCTAPLAQAEACHFSLSIIAKTPGTKTAAVTISSPVGGLVSAPLTADITP